MTIENWLKAAQADADKRGLPALKALLEPLARATQALRAADFNQCADQGPGQCADQGPSTTAGSRTKAQGQK